MDFDPYTTDEIDVEPGVLDAIETLTGVLCRNETDKLMDLYICTCFFQKMKKGRLLSY